MMTLLEELIQYSNEVLEGKIIACQKHKWACLRFMNDLNRAVAETEDFPFVWNEERARRIVKWFTYLKHTKGKLAGEFIELDIWQKFIYCNIFGWVHKKTGYRRFRKGYIQVARKNAKSQGLSGVALYMTAADAEASAECYCAATKRSNAKIVWAEAKAMAKGSPFLKKRMKITRDVISHGKTDSVLIALSKEDNKEGDGFNPHFGSVDEYHLHPTDEVYNVLSSGMGARTQPLLLVITTAGFNLQRPCYLEYLYCEKILNPDTDINNDRYFVMICELDKDDDPFEENNWRKPNPIVGKSPEGMDYLREQAQIAKDAPEKMRNYLTKHMNVWVDQKENGYMNMEKWAACGVDNFDLKQLRGRECIIGVDLAQTDDLSSISFEFNLDDGTIVVFTHSFLPEETLEVKIAEDKFPYRQWVDQGWITVTDGAVTDYRYIQKYIIDKEEEQNWIIKEICYDRFSASQFAFDLVDQGYTLIPIRQGMITLSEPTKNFRELVYFKKLIHINDPVLTWAVGNAITRTDYNANIMLDKQKSPEKIDPIASTINAHVRMMNFNKPKVYDEGDVEEFFASSEEN